MNLIKNELFKINKSKNKNIIIFTFLFLLLWSSISYLIIDNSDGFISNLINFYNFGIPILIPVSICAFTISNICDEYNSKSIKYLILSKYSNSEIVVSKFISISVYTIFIYMITIIIYTILNFNYSDVSNIYINFKLVSKFDLIFNILETNIYILLYILSIISMSIMLGILFKRYDISLLIFMVIFIFIFSIDHKYLNYTFFVGSKSHEYLGLFGYYSDKLINLLSSLGSIFFTLFISIIIMDKQEY